MSYLIINTATKQAFLSKVTLQGNKQSKDITIADIPENRCAELILSKLKDLGEFCYEAIIIVTGHGSWTGLRIGISTAQVLSWTTKTPIVQVLLDMSISSSLTQDQIIQEIFELARPKLEAKEYVSPTQLVPQYDKPPNITSPKQK